ncbi:MAG: hypothetical protein P5686_14425, partial [Limnospira sp. PMC 1254.20]|nr:hypothetical protein [Limnospira sp. PMC 1254.20]
MRPATEPPAWVAPYDYGKEAGSFVGWVKPNRRLCRLGETQQQVRDGVFGLRPATEPPAWVAPYDYGKEAGSFVGWVKPNRRLCRLGETQQQVR